MNLKNHSRFRVVFENREHYRVLDEQKSIWPAELSGKIRLAASLWPTVGDWIEGRPQPGDWVLIESVLPKKSVLSRKDPAKGHQVLAANIDTLFVVTSANQDLNFERLDRYVSLASSGGMTPVILLNKVELIDDPAKMLDDIAARFPSVDVHGVSALEGWNIDGLLEYMPPMQTVAFVGSSGVGKSSLVNALIGSEKVSTGLIRESDSRGRHTTTHRELHSLPGGAFVIDTPGIRQVGLTDETQLDVAFADIEAWAAQCRFGDCRHQSEPGCAIVEALGSGQLDERRWQSYLKLQREIAFERRKTDKALQSEEKRKWAKIHMANRARMKIRGK